MLFNRGKVVRDISAKARGVHEGVLPILYKGGSIINFSPIISVIRTSEALESWHLAPCLVTHLAIANDVLYSSLPVRTACGKPVDELLGSLGQFNLVYPSRVAGPIDVVSDVGRIVVSCLAKVLAS